MISLHSNWRPCTRLRNWPRRYTRRMVRRDAKNELTPQGEGTSFACCACPAGESPVPVSVGAPGSRPQAEQADLAARAGCRKPVEQLELFGGEPARGPQHEVKPAASPKAKSARVQRQSEGIVVLHTKAQAAVTKAARHNAAGGKGPCGGHAGDAGKREGMAGQTGPKNPVGRESHAKVRQLQRQLWAAAKRAPGRRFHALYGQICRDDILQEAWRRVKANRGAAGVDRQSIDQVEQYGVDQFLEELAAVLGAGEYRAPAVRRTYIPKADGGKRPLGIPTVRDRVVQMAAKLVLEPVYEADFKSCSYGFGPKRSATQALEELRKLGARGGEWVLEADIRDYFGSIEHDELMKLVGRRVSDRRMLKLPRQWLHAGVLEEGEVRSSVAGTPQGGVISPLLAKRPQPARRRSASMEPRVLRNLRSVSSARQDPLPGAVPPDQEARVMLRADTPPVSRVREIRTHGLNGGVGSFISAYS